MQEGYSTRTVETFDEALNALTTQTWSLLLLGTWGAVRQEELHQLLGRATAAARDTPILLLTARRETAERGEASLTVAAVIRKPFDLEPFLRRVRELAGAPRR